MVIVDALTEHRSIPVGWATERPVNVAGAEVIGAATTAQFNHLSRSSRLFQFLIVYIQSLVRLIVVHGRTTQVASLFRCNHQITPSVNMRGYAALIPPSARPLRYNEAQLTSTMG